MSDNYYSDLYGKEDEKIPHSPEGEQALLGCLLYENRAVYSQIRDVIKPEHFYNPIHERIAKAIFTRSRRGQEVDAIILKNKFSQDETLVDIGGVEYLSLLLDNAPAISTAVEYAKLVVDLAVRRGCIYAARQMIANVSDPDFEGDSVDLLAMHRSELQALEGHIPHNATFITLQDAAREAVSVIGQERAMGLPTGYDEIDDKIAALGRGKLITIAGRPSMGKTSLVTNIARNLAKSAPSVNIGFFSQEMPSVELGTRAASAAVGTGFGIQYRHIAQHNITDNQKARLEVAVNDVPANIHIDETANLTFSAIDRRAKAMEKQNGSLDCIIVDYLQLMSGADCEDPRNKVSYLGEIAKRFKTLAKEMNIPVILLSQLSRAVEARENKRPIMPDLQGSGGIEDASDVIMFVYRKEKYLIDEGEPEKQDKKDLYYSQLADCRDKVDIIICLLYTSPSPRDATLSRMPSSA